MDKSYINNEITNLLEAPEGENYQFKEANNRFSYTEALKICCALSNCGGGNLFWGLQTNVRERLLVVRHLNSRNGQERV